MRLQRQLAERDGVAVVEAAIDVHGRKRVGVAEGKVVVPAVLDDVGIGAADHQLRSGVLLQLREAGGMVEVRLRVEEDPDLLHLEAEGSDVLLDLRHGGLVAGVDHDVPGRRGNQVRADVAGADKVQVTGDPERIDRLIVRALREGDGGGSNRRRHHREERLPHAC